MKTGEIIKKMRLEKGLTLAECAEKIGITYQILARIEAKNSTPITKKDRDKVNDFFDEDLF